MRTDQMRLPLQIRALQLMFRILAACGGPGRSKAGRLLGWPPPSPLPLVNCLQRPHGTLKESRNYVLLCWAGRDCCRYLTLREPTTGCSARYATSGHLTSNSSRCAAREEASVYTVLSRDYAGMRPISGRVREQITSCTRCS